MNHITSPDTSDAGIERLIQDKGKTAPREQQAKDFIFRGVVHAIARELAS